MDKKKIFVAVRTEEELYSALSSESETIFLLACNIEGVKNQIEKAHLAGKKLFVHLDLAEGIGKDDYGIKYLKKLGVDGIISTRTNIIKLAKKAEVYTVQRFFIVDSHSIETTLDAIKICRPDMIEIMPGLVTKVVKRIKEETDAPIVAGGLFSSVEEMEKALLDGAEGVSVSAKNLW